jgi:HD superfamily phosphodiesterase
MLNLHKDEDEWEDGLSSIVSNETKKDNIILKQQNKLLSLITDYFINGYMILHKVISFARDLMKDRYDTHGLRHCLKVMDNSLHLLKYGNDYYYHLTEDVSAVALLHDVYDHKYEDSDKRKALVEQLVKDLKLNPETIMAIDSISFSKEKKLGMHWYQNKLSKRMLRVRNIVSDADKLEALGEEGYNRCVAFIKEKNKDISDAKVRELLLEHCKEKLFVMEPYFKTKNGIETCRMLTKELKDRVLEDVV